MTAIWTILRGFILPALPYIKKLAGNWKVWVGLALFTGAALASYQIVTLKQELADCKNVTPMVHWMHDTLPPLPPVILPPAKPIVVQDPSLKRYADSLLTSSASKDSIIQAWAQLFTDERSFTTTASVKDTNITLTVSGLLKHSFNHRDGFGARIDFDRILLPVKIIEKTLPPEPLHQHLFDLYTKVQLGGLWNRSFAHDLAASGEFGLKANIGKTHISFSAGAASMQSKGYAYYVFGLEHTITQ